MPNRKGHKSTLNNKCNRFIIVLFVFRAERLYIDDRMMQFALGMRFEIADGHATQEVCFSREVEATSGCRSS